MPGQGPEMRVTAERRGVYGLCGGEPSLHLHPNCRDFRGKAHARVGDSAARWPEAGSGRNADACILYSHVDNSILSWNRVFATKTSENERACQRAYIGG